MLAASSLSPPNPASPDTPVTVAEHAGPKIHSLELDAPIAAPEPEPVKEEAAPPADQPYDALPPAVESQPELVDDAITNEPQQAEATMEVDGSGEMEIEGEPEQREAEASGDDEGAAYADVTMDGDVAMENGVGHSPPAGSSTTAVDSMVEDEQPPVKRARVDSDADLASSHSASQPTAAALSAGQHKHLLQTVRSLKKLKDAGPFRIPVDAVALGIPHYYQVITHPMDLATAERKLLSSNPAKPDPNPSNPRYATADEFIRDMRLIFQNALTFNGPDHAVTLMGKSLEASFDRLLKGMPPPEDEDRAAAAPSWLARPSHSASGGSRPSKPSAIKREKVSSPPPTSASKKSSVQRRPSTTTPSVRRDDSHRPKREVHPPPSREHSMNEPKKQQLSAPPRRRPSKSGAANEQLKYCGSILAHLNRKQFYNTVVHFSEPVDWKALQIPDYPKIIKKPMDLRTMRQKLDHDEYASAERFRADFDQIIKNCRAYNAPGTLVFNAGQDLQRLFEEKWRGMPPLRPTIESEDDGENDYDDDDEERERHRKMKEMQAKMQELQAQMEEMQQSPSIPAKKPKAAPAPAPSKKRKPPPAVEPSASAPLPSSSKVKKERAPPPPLPPPKKKAPSRKSTTIPDDDVLSFDQKKELSDAIGTLDGAKLERVINIIHEGVPEIRDSQEEIELEIDSLPAGVLTKLYNFVIRPMKPPPPKKPRTGKGTGTGGLKRKSMDEDVEEAKIRKLEAQMRLFDEHAAGGAPGGSAPLGGALPPIPAAHESDSSSDDESSGSDTE